MAKKVEIEQTEIEAPYELPDGWKWERLGDFIDTYRGVSYKKTDVHSERLENDCLIMRGGNIDEGKINTETDNVYVDKSLVSQNQFVQKNDVIIVTSTGSTKVIGRAGISYQNYSDVAFGAFLTLARPNGKAEKTFVNQYFQSPLYRERIRQLASGVNINNIRLEYITESPFPLPPTLAEQQRIVNRIETMFEKLDQAQEKAQSVLDSFETRKAAILHKAFTGELTANWRKENGVPDDSWEEKTLQDICIKEITDGTHKTPIYVDEKTGVPFISGKDVSNEIIDWSDLRYIPNELHKELYERLAPQVDDILLSKNGARLGKAAIVETDLVFDIYVTLALLRPNKDLILSRYLWRIINSPVIQAQIQNHLTGIGMPNLHLRDIKGMTICIPSLEEQQEIVRILDNVLEKESHAKEAAQTVLDQIALLKKSILARAFRGEL